MNSLADREISCHFCSDINTVVSLGKNNKIGKAMSRWCNQCRHPERISFRHGTIICQNPKLSAGKVMYIFSAIQHNKKKRSKFLV